MGIGASKSPQQKEQLKLQTQQNRLIEEELQRQQLSEKRIQKILLLGPGETGKSTVFKQMKILHCHGFSEDEVDLEKRDIEKNLIESMISLINAMSRLTADPVDERFRDDLNFVTETWDTHGKETRLTEELGRSIQNLWKSNGIQKIYERRQEFYLIDSAKYFLDSVERINSRAYRPNMEDMLRCRRATIGIKEMNFEVKNWMFKFIDVGGQRTERRKWIPFFETVNTILFIASLSEYNQNLQEDEKTYAAIKKWCDEILKPWLTLYTGFLEGNPTKSGWFVGAGMTYADLYIGEFLTRVQMWNKEAIKDHPKMQALLDKVHSIPGIAKRVQNRADSLSKAWDGPLPPL